MKGCWKEPSTGIVHLKNAESFCGGEYTLCGDAYDRPQTEDGEQVMVECNDPCNCESCIRMANELMPYLKSEIKRVLSVVEGEVKND